MFPTLPTLSRISFSRLMTGAVLSLLVSLAHAQTLTDIQALMKEGKLPQALTQIDRYIAAQPKDAQGPFTKGLILSEMGRPQDAIKVFSELTENFPELPEPYNNLAVLYAQQKQYDKAQAALETAIHTHPSYAIAHENLGDVYARLASQAYDKALQFDSTNRTTQNKLSMIRELISVSLRSGVKPGVVAAKTANRPEKTTVDDPSAKPLAPPPVAAAPVTPPPAAAAGGSAGKAPAAAKPDEAGKAEPSAAEAEDEIVKTVRHWADAWSRKDVNAYLAFYAGDFQTPNGMPLRKWETERRQRIDKPGKLQVDIEDIEVSVSGGTATARFRQRYASATFRSLANKTLVFVKSGSRWLISRERVN
ncbi:MAG: tetratricopeptide repeat protein [Candidatus Accumulibacter sp.]|jgi:ketosteroid isomerase-like protein|nr:tetratricopeptide repeat protein [Accumulibacter sp.]